MRKVRRLLKENWIPIVVGILLTKWAVDYAYRVRGYDAIGSEWLRKVEEQYVPDIYVGNKNEEENL